MVGARSAARGAISAAMRADINNIKLEFEELHEGQISAREEIQSMRGDGLRNEPLWPR
jgi:hypothetical protein